MMIASVVGKTAAPPIPITARNPINICGVEANAAKLLAADAAVEATEAAQITFGGFGYAKEYHVERLVREALLFRIVPVTPQMLLSFIAEKALGLPKSY